MLTMLYEEPLILISGFDLMRFLKLSGYCLAFHSKRSCSLGCESQLCSMPEGSRLLTAPSVLRQTDHGRLGPLRS